MLDANQLSVLQDSTELCNPSGRQWRKIALGCRSLNKKIDSHGQAFSRGWNRQPAMVPEAPLTEADYVNIAASALAEHEKNLSDTECEIHARRMFIMLKAVGLWPPRR